MYSCAQSNVDKATIPRFPILIKNEAGFFIRPSIIAAKNNKMIYLIEPLRLI